MYTFTAAWIFRRPRFLFANLRVPQRPLAIGRKSVIDYLLSLPGGSSPEHVDCYEACVPPPIGMSGSQLMKNVEKIIVLQEALNAETQFGRAWSNGGRCVFPEQRISLHC